jgi:hypothetical protein
MAARVRTEGLSRRPHQSRHLHTCFTLLQHCGHQGGGQQAGRTFSLGEFWNSELAQKSLLLPISMVAAIRLMRKSFKVSQ